MSPWYRAGLQERIDIGFIRHATAEAVAIWFKDNWAPPFDIHTLAEDINGDEQGRRSLEYVALRRRHPVIDLVVARYGFSCRSIERAYDRGGPSIQAAALINPRGGLRLRQAMQVLHTARLDAYAAMLRNDGILRGDIEDILQRSGLAKGLADDRYLKVIDALSSNPRLKLSRNPTLKSPANRQPFAHLAWKLAETLPATENWARALERLLRAVGVPRVSGAPAVLDRWRTNDPAATPETRYSHRPFFDLRVVLAGALEADEVLLTADDLAARISFYVRFQPRKFPDWESFVERDGRDFLDAAVRNEQLWMSEATRQALWRLREDPETIDHLYWNAERKFAAGHPEWFAVLANEPKPGLAQIEKKLPHP